MTTTPFDDHIAFDRRWSHCDPTTKHALAEADPLLFVADHIPSGERREGSVAVALSSHDGQSALMVVSDAPVQPPDIECLALLSNAIERSGGGVRTLGIVHHRRGGHGITDLDRRWALALTAVCTAFDIRPLGVLARLYTGDIVRVPLPDVLPSDYFDALES